MTLQLGHYIALASVLFFIGAAGFLVRRNALVSLMCIELMLNAVNLTLVAFNRWHEQVPIANPAVSTVGVTPASTPPHGQVFAFFVIAVAAAEAAVGLAIVLSLYRIRKTVRIDDADSLRQ